MAATAQVPETPMLVLEATAQAPALARRFLAELFRKWGDCEDYVARLVVCELVTNAYQHGEGPIVVRVHRGGPDELPLLEVSDGGRARPVVRAGDGAATSGRGLLLVSEMAAAWGVRPLDEGGKVVWAKCPF